MTELPEPIANFSGEETDDLVDQQLGRLDEMFGDAGLVRLRTRHASHPAVRQYDGLLELRDHGVRWPDEVRPLQGMGIVGLDFTTWAPEPPYEDFWDFLEAETRRWTVQMIRNPEQYEDVMAELFVWGWLRQQDLDARRINVEGQSDIVVGSEDWPCEVKRIHIGTGTGRIGKVLSKANRQIKARGSDQAGTAFISIARTDCREALDDRLPNDVTPFIDATRAALRSGQNRSVAQAVVSWDDVQALGEPPMPMLYVFRRRSVVVEHPEPRQRGPYSVEDVTVGRTATTWIRWDGPTEASARLQLAPIETGEVVISQQFRTENELADGLRTNHAVEALLEPDGLAIQRYGEVEVRLATRRISRGRHPYTLLVIAVKLPGAKLSITHGYRLYRGKRGDDLSKDPASAFQALLERYGLDVQVGAVKRRFVTYGATAPGEGLEVARESGQVAINALSKVRPSGWVEHSWVFALDTAKYRAAVRQHAS